MIFFKSKEEIKISLLMKYKNKNIYKYIDSTGCEKIFSTTCKYVGFFDVENYFVVNLINESFADDLHDNDLQKILNQIGIDNIKLSLQPIMKLSEKDKDTWRGTRKHINSINNFKYNINLVDFINLSEAKKKLYQLNDILSCIDYKLSIDYIFQMNLNTQITKSNMASNPTRLLLCMFHDTNCISSIEISYIRDTEKHIEISSETNESYLKLKLNKILRAVIIYIATDLYPEISSVLSVSINPISAYLMIKYFKADIYIPKQDLKTGDEFNLECYDIQHSIKSDFSSIKQFVQDNKTLHNKTLLTVVKINKISKAIAFDVFNNTIQLDEFKCNKKEMGKLLQPLTLQNIPQSINKIIVIYTKQVDSGIYLLEDNSNYRQITYGLNHSIVDNLDKLIIDKIRTHLSNQQSVDFFANELINTNK